MTIRPCCRFAAGPIPLLVFIVSAHVAGCTQYKVAPDDGGQTGGAGGTDGAAGVDGSTGGGAGADGGTDAPVHCSVASECSACQTCSASGQCAPILNQDDPIAGRCAGTCDDSGACRSKRGQMCQATSGGCIGSAVCAPDGYCCDRACANSCEACDVMGFLGTCTPVASGVPHGNRTSCGTGICAGTCAGRTDGLCEFPAASACGPASSCSGTDLVGQGSCSAGSCVLPAAQKCPDAFVCSGSACKLSCAADGDCVSGHYCAAGTCHLAAVAVMAAGNHSCAILQDGTLRCWGLNDSGQLGDGSTGNSAVPIPVPGLTDVTMVAGSFSHTCALSSGGSVRCWGANYNGQLGDGTTDMSPRPVAVGGLSGATGIAVGSGAYGFSCATLQDGTVRCWGLIGAINSPTPVPVAGITGALRIAAGPFQACAIVSGGGGRCWGATASPVPVTDLAGAAAITVGSSHACALLSDGTVSCWGSNSDSQLALSSGFLASAAPIALGGLSGVTALAAGGYHNCALLAGGALRCWGRGLEGQLGNGSMVSSFSFVTPSGLNSGVATIAAGIKHSCAILANGSIRRWGENADGRLGNGLTTSSSTPVVVSGW